jgi:aerobic-type carbon monoxide dehydrogenase small subunit (CoxS/CutS family)
MDMHTLMTKIPNTTQGATDVPKEESSTVTSLTVTEAQKDEMHPMQAAIVTNNMARSEYCSNSPNVLPNMELVEELVEFNSLSRY